MCGGGGGGEGQTDIPPCRSTDLKHDQMMCRQEVKTTKGSLEGNPHYLNLLLCKHLMNETIESSACRHSHLNDNIFRIKKSSFQARYTCSLKYSGLANRFISSLLRLHGDKPGSEATSQAIKL